MKETSSKKSNIDKNKQDTVWPSWMRLSHAFKHANSNNGLVLGTENK